MSSIYVTAPAHKFYLDLDAKCRSQYGSLLVANYVADEIRRLVLQLSVKPRQQSLMKHRIPKGNPIIDFWYAIIVPTPTGYEYDAAVLWTFRGSDGAPIVLDIELEYLR